MVITFLNMSPRVDWYPLGRKIVNVSIQHLQHYLLNHCIRSRVNARMHVMRHILYTGSVFRPIKFGKITFRSKALEASSIFSNDFEEHLCNNWLKNFLEIFQKKA